MNKVGKRAKTYLLLGIVLTAGLAAMIANKVIAKSGDFVQITVDGKVIKEMPLSEDAAYHIEGVDGINELIIENGVCYMKEADCPDKLCVKQGRINESGQSIICLPHRVVVTIKGDEPKAIDSIAK